MSFEGFPPHPHFTISIFVDRDLAIQEVRLSKVTLQASRLNFQISSPELPLPPPLLECI